MILKRLISFVFPSHQDSKSRISKERHKQATSISLCSVQSKSSNLGNYLNKTRTYHKILLNLFLFDSEMSQSKDTFDSCVADSPIRSNNRHPFQVSLVDAFFHAQEQPMISRSVFQLECASRNYAIESPAWLSIGF